jgi:enediyne biosynthesis protein E4
MTNPVGTCIAPLTSPGFSDAKASRNSGRNPAGSTPLKYPPLLALGSIETCLATVAKSSPCLNRAKTCSASAAVATTITWKLTLPADAFCAETGVREVAKAKIRSANAPAAMAAARLNLAIFMKATKLAESAATGHAVPQLWAAATACTMLESGTGMRLRVSLIILGVSVVVFPAQKSTVAPSAVGAAPGKFTDVASALGVHFQNLSSHTSKKYLLETMGAGVALFDYDNDGRLDIYFVNGAPLSDPTPKGTIPQKTGPQYWNRLYHQKPDGAFEDVTEKAGLQGTGYGMGVAVGDYDNDGYEDLFVTAYGGNKLYHNNGDGTFTDVTEKAGVGGSGWSTSAAWVDLDGDGLLDLVVLRYVKWDFDDIYCGVHKEGGRDYCHPDVFQPIAPLVYHNDGNGHFTEVSEKIRLSKPGKSLGIAFADYDRDGRTDIFVANDSMVEFLYHNKGDGTFEETGLMSGVAVDGNGKTYAGMGVDFADYNNGGLPDLIVTNLANQQYALYQNNGDGSFNYTSFASGIAAITLKHSGWGARFFDYDNDGWKDLLVAQGHDLESIQTNYPDLRYREPMLLARNTGKGFVDVSKESGEVFQRAWVGRGLAIGDIDNDGRVDAVVTTNDGPAYILRNETPTQNHWLTLKLVGHKSNRDAIGAEVKLTTSKGSQLETVTTAASYLSSSDKRVHFGLGSDTSAQSIEIRWPSGIVQTLKNVRADQILQVDEAEASAAGKRVN